MTFLDPVNIVRVPSGWKVFQDVKVWFEEAVFGHRIWARQNPWLLFLEFLNVAEAQTGEGRVLFSPAAPDVAQPYRLRYRMGLRTILFAHNDLFEIAREGFDDDAKWTLWLESMASAQGAPPEGFGYLKERFRSFREFADLVALIRQTTLEGTANLRWSSRFIFPFGVNALYTDATVGKAGPARDYINFGRTGELLYYMVSRSGRGEALRPYFEAFLAKDQPKNALAVRLCAESDERPGQEMLGNSFLPYRTHPAFERLADDWLAILALELPAQDAFAYLAPLASLHVMLFQLETAAALSGRADRPSLVCEIIAPRRELVRQRSIASYNTNDALIRLAMSETSDQLFDGLAPDKTDPDLTADEALDHMKNQLLARSSFEPDEQRIRTPEDLRAAFDDAVETKLDDSSGNVHSAYGRYIGLVSRRGTNRYRYAPTDEFMKMAVMARVHRRMELSRFLEELYRAYGLVFGPEEAQLALPAQDFDHASFAKNRDRLEARLSSMGLLKRLSDGCAYVINPLGSIVA